MYTHIIGMCILCIYDVRAPLRGSRGHCCAGGRRDARPANRRHYKYVPELHQTNKLHIDNNNDNDAYKHKHKLCTRAAQVRA